MAESWKELTWTTPELITAADLDAQAENTDHVIEGLSSFLVYNHIPAITDLYYHEGAGHVFQFVVKIGLNTWAMFSSDEQTDGWTAVNINWNPTLLVASGEVVALSICVKGYASPVSGVGLIDTDTYYTQPKDCTKLHGYFEYKHQGTLLTVVGIRNIHLWASRYNYGESP